MFVKQKILKDDTYFSLDLISRLLCYILVLTLIKNGRRFDCTDLEVPFTGDFLKENNTRYGQMMACIVIWISDLFSCSPLNSEDFF